MTSENAEVSPEITPYRVEHDSMGEIRVPAAAKWGAQTQRAVENFLLIQREHLRLMDATGEQAA